MRSFLPPLCRTLLAVSVAVAVAGCANSSTTPDPSAANRTDDAKISWRTWDDEAFKLAKETGRLVVIDVGIEGCTACRWMDEDTYSNPEVVSLVEENFVAIQVDAEARPDLGERYSNWAWPATIFLTPDGEQVLALRGNKRPRNFIPILRTLLDKKRAGTLSGDVAATLPPPVPVTSEITAIRDRVAAQLDRSFVPDSGWNSKVVHALPERLEHTFVRARIRDDGTMKARALNVATARAALLDDEWGGIFVAGLAADPANEIIPEKRTRHQAGAMEAFATAYQWTGDEVWRERALNIDRYLQSMMRDDDGTYFTTQEDDAPKLPPELDARAYYRLPDAERRQFGIPPIDHATYSDRNGAVIRGYLALFRATGDSSYRDIAVAAATTLVTTRTQPEGWIAQTTADFHFEDKRMRALATAPRLFLRTQAQLGLALIDLAEATRDEAWLQRADGIAKALDLIEDADGGFFASTSAAGVVGRRLKPLEDNATAARFLWRLGQARQNAALLSRAERTLRAVTSSAQVKAEGKAIGQTATALELVASGPVRFVIVTSASGAHAEANAAAAQALWDASLRVYEPRRVLRVEPPGHYPDRGQTTLYICTDDACSVPIVNVEAIAKEANRFAAAGAR